MLTSVPHERVGASNPAQVIVGAAVAAKEATRGKPMPSRGRVNNVSTAMAMAGGPITTGGRLGKASSASKLNWLPLSSTTPLPTSDHIIPQQPQYEAHLHYDYPPQHYRGPYWPTVRG
jgi:hypothetical protein